MVSKAEFDSIIIGGGFYGCCLALFLQNILRQKTIILENESDLLQRASYANQARIHQGYHYPRSIWTALRSCVNYLPFVKKFQGCIDDRFQMYYAIPRLHSNVNSSQFKIFCERINAPIERAPKNIKKLFNLDLIEDVFLVQEYAFDAVKLKNKLLQEIDESGVKIKYNTKANKIRKTQGGNLEVTYTTSNEQACITGKNVFNCTYSGMNNLLVSSGLPVIPLKHELTEIVMIEMPEHLKHIGVTVMCGPFFSTMPFPPLKLHSFTHVRYTPHCEWHDSENESHKDPYELFELFPKKSNFAHMIKDAQRYIPSLNDCKYVESIWEVKTILPLSEVDDSRPILLKRNYGFKNFTCIMGAKIDNVFDMLNSTKPNEL